MDLPLGGVINIGEKPLPQSRGYFDPSMGVPMPGMEWILFQGRWGGLEGGDPSGVGTPSFSWYDGYAENPPAVWKVPDQVAKVNEKAGFELGEISFGSGYNIDVFVDWGDNSDEFSPIELDVRDGVKGRIRSQHTYTEVGEYIVTVTVVDNDNNLWGGNVFKVTVSD
jgi:hypothetical protein